MYTTHVPMSPPKSPSPRKILTGIGDFWVLHIQLSGLVLLLIAFALIAVVNFHDLLAHLAGLDFRLSLFAYDTQLAVVEFAAPLLHILGCLCSFLGILFLFIQEEKRNYGNYELEKQALSLLIAGPTLWLLGSILNSCQIYERAGGHMQILQQSAHIPFVMGSLLFLVGAILNFTSKDNHHTQLIYHSFRSLLLELGILGLT
nr:General transcription factor IIF subunit 1 [Ipomoea batatas]